MINTTNTNAGTSTPNANKSTTIAKTIGYITIGRLFFLLMKNPKRLVPNTDAIPVANKNVDIDSSGTLVNTANIVEK